MTSNFPSAREHLSYYYTSSYHLPANPGPPTGMKHTRE